MKMLDKSISSALIPNIASLKKTLILYGWVLLALFLNVSSARSAEYLAALELYGIPDFEYTTDKEEARRNMEVALCKNNLWVKKCAVTLKNMVWSGYSWGYLFNYQYTAHDGSLSPLMEGGFVVLHVCPKNTVLYSYEKLCRREEVNCDACDAGQNELPELVGNPISVVAGVKQQIEEDYTNQPGTLKFSRTYRSDRGTWAHNFQKYAIDLNAATPAISGNCLVETVYVNSQIFPNQCFPFVFTPRKYNLIVRRGNGRVLTFGGESGFEPARGINDYVETITNASGNVVGWNVTSGNSGEVERYSLDGKIIESTALGGSKLTYTYSDSSTPGAIAPGPGYLIKVTDTWGQALRFTYDQQGRMYSLIDPNGRITSYEYDANDLIKKVTRPDGTSRTYIYGETDNTASAIFPRLLTGILDENGARFATYKYDTQGRGVSTEHAGGSDKWVLSYPSFEYTYVTSPFGLESSYIFTDVHGIRKIRAISYRKDGIFSQQSIGYNEQGNVSTKTAFDGTRTQFTYDLTRNLETKRVEGVDTPYARTITTAWHPTFRLPAKIIEPLKVTKFKYDTTGNLLEKTVQATLDKTGAQGAAAAVTGKIRTWTYTYNTVGQMLTSTDPDTATTTFTYDGKGNLQTVENALKQVTKYSNYDAHGRVGRIEDPNGLVQELTYTPRGWLETRTVKGRQWRYAYDGVGQLKQVDSPDGTFVSYTYDDAHRLVKVTDSLGNSITYTLDAMGNRKAEEVKDPSNTLVRKVSRTYDTLNQLKQQTGGAL